MAEAIFIVWWICMAVLVVRVHVAYRARDKAIDIDFHAVLRGPSARKMMIDLRKWTFAQFYPELARKVAP